MSDFDALVAAINHGYASPRPTAGGQLPQGAGLPGRPPGLLRPARRAAVPVTEINALEHTPDWSSTAVVIAYDDSDGCYDHVFSGVHNPSDTSTVTNPPGPQDFLRHRALRQTTITPLAGEQGRCGYGPRLPLLVVSPWARSNYVDHTLTDQSSIIRFVEDNWQLPRIPGLLRRDRGLAQLDVRLPPSPWGERAAVPRSDHGRTLPGLRPVVDSR